MDHVRAFGQQRTTVDNNGLAGNVTGLITGKVNHGPGNIIRFAQGAERDELLDQLGEAAERLHLRAARGDGRRGLRQLLLAHLKKLYWTQGPQTLIDFIVGFFIHG